MDLLASMYRTGLHLAPLAHCSVIPGIQCNSSQFVKEVEMDISWW